RAPTPNVRRPTINPESSWRPRGERCSAYCRLLRFVPPRRYEPRKFYRQLRAEVAPTNYVRSARALSGRRRETSESSGRRCGSPDGLEELLFIRAAVQDVPDLRVHKISTRLARVVQR